MRLSFSNLLGGMRWHVRRTVLLQQSKHETVVGRLQEDDHR